MADAALECVGVGLGGRGLGASVPELKLWRYPVKSMLGEECSSLVVDARVVMGGTLTPGDAVVRIQ